ncbi:uncharacterized protein [Venturia canescens]|uniref:uncharacterized protein n=1 Tax=Venturia canescens TaxID=32260 RepID=UPI001C9C4CB4|nr:uncharacterized protein LOC122407886 [Venturia canescens]
MHGYEHQKKIFNDKLGNLLEKKIFTMLEYEAPMTHFFFPNACNVCHVYGKDVELKRCSSCKMITYCGRKHQIEHWPLHKDICRVLSDILKEKGKLYEPRTNMERKEAWLVVKTHLKRLVERKLGRTLTNHEMEMIQAPRSCEICHETDPQKLSNCNDCPFASFCNKHPQDSKHSEKCKANNIFLETHFVMLPPGEYFESNNYGKSIPRDMKEAIKLYESTYRFDKLFEPKRIWDIVLSDHISRVYTFLYVMEKLALPKTDKMTVHIIGSTLMELGTAYYWRRVLHHVKHLRHLKIVFIGPEIEVEYKMLFPCDRYTVNHRQLEVEYVGKLYASYAAEKSFKKPSCIIGFNLGIYASAPETDTWAPSIRVMAKLGCPFAWTAIHELESKCDRDRVSTIMGKKFKCSWAGENPFASWKLVRNVIMGDFFKFNQYLNIYEKIA